MASIDNIHRVAGFLSADDVESVVSFCKQNETLSSNKERSILQADYNTEISEWTKQYTKNVVSIVRDTFGVDVVDLCGTALRNWRPGEKQDPHADCEAIFYDDVESGKTLMTPINNFSSILIEYAALTYLNEDYSGGEIYFPQFDLEIKPKIGELIFFPGTQHYVHGVKEVASGNRLAFMTFFTTTKLKYIWKTFVQDQSDLVVVDRNLQESMNTASIFTRSNMPENLMSYFQ